MLSSFWFGIIVQAASVCCTDRANVYHVAGFMGLPFVGQELRNGTPFYFGFIPEYFQYLQVKNICYFEYKETDEKSSPMNSSWDGVVKALVDEVVDVAVGPIAVGGIPDQISLHNRINFVGKFADHQGWTALVKRPVKPEYDIWKKSLFLFKPFRIEVWLAVIVVFAMVSTLLGIIGKINPYEWRGLCERYKESKDDRQQLNPISAVFITLSTFLWQGYEKSPRSAGGRILLLFWMTFVTVTISTYMANMMNLFKLISHEYNSRPLPCMSHPLELLDDRNSHVKFGTLRNWLVIENLLNHNDPSVRKLAKLLKEHGENVESVEKGIQSVRNHNECYAFIIDSVVAKYATRDNCDIISIGAINPGSINGYTFATFEPLSADRPDVKKCFKCCVSLLPNDNEAARVLWNKWDNSYKYGRCHKNYLTNRENDASYDHPNFTPLNIYHFCGPLGLAALGVAISVIATSLEASVYYVRLKLKKANVLDVNNPADEVQRLHLDGSDQ